METTRRAEQPGPEPPTNGIRLTVPPHPVVGEVYTPRELAAAADVALDRVCRWIEGGAIRAVDGHHVAHADAVAFVRAARQLPVAAEQGVQPWATTGLFALPSPDTRAAGLPLLLSTAIHGLAVAGVALVSTIGLTRATSASSTLIAPEPVRLVFTATPGPGGGGGGGGRLETVPAPKIERKGPPKTVSSPVPERRLPAPLEPTPAPPEPPPLEHQPLPPITAPIVAAPADLRDRMGTLESAEENEGHGPGEGGGAGDGAGRGIGEGTGGGLGPGTGGGYGGGLYGPGSGVTPPVLLWEVKPSYTEQARRLGLEGDVVLEIVVRSDGSVGDVRVISSLGAGLDERAAAAVRQWRFDPATRQGQAVNVIVEVAVEFALR